MDTDVLFREINAFKVIDDELPRKANRNWSLNRMRSSDFERNPSTDFFAPEADPILFYEDVKIKSGETIIGLLAEYGFDPNDWREIWNDAKNNNLRTKRKLSTNIRSGDTLYIPIKWRITSKTLNSATSSFRMVARRNGHEGGRIDWVQTVYGHNQPNFGTMKVFPAFSVDLPTDDNTPFYWTQKEYDDGQRRNLMSDRPFRNPPTVAQGTTTWRAVTSLCVVTNKRVSIWDTFVWGINFQPNGTNVAYPIRPATQDEINGHLNLLRKKTGLNNVTFTNLGWTFVNRNPVVV